MNWAIAVVTVLLESAAPTGPIPPPAAAATPDDSLTVRACVARAWQVGAALLAARDEIVAADLDARAAQRAASPRVELHSGLWLAPYGFYDPAITNLGEYDLKLVGTMRLRDAGEARRLRSRSVATAGSARVELVRDRRDIGRDVAQLAEGIVTAAHRAARREASMHWATSILHAIEAGARAGTRSPSDVVRLQLDVETLDLDRLSLERSREDLGRALAAILFPDSIDVGFTRVRDTLVSEGGPSPADSSRILAAFATSGEIRRAESEVELARLDLEAARARRALTLDLTMDAGLAGSGLNHLVPPDLEPNGGGTLTDRLRRDAGASLALDLHVPLLAPGAGATVDARAASLQAAERRLVVARSAAPRAALDLLSRWWLAARRAGAHQRAVREAQAHLDRSQSLYLAGTSSLLELLDARHLLEDSLDHLDDARSDLDLAVLEAEIGP